MVSAIFGDAIAARLRQIGQIEADTPNMSRGIFR
jgi:hypothetical protein